MTSLMWIGPMRTTTAVLVVAFLFKAIARRDYRWVLALLGWMAGFEAAYLMTAEALGRAPVPQYFELVGLSAGGWLLAFHVAGLRPRYEWLLAGILLWVAWVLIGFPSNEHYSRTINWLAEVVNVATKTCLGFAFYFASDARSQAGDVTRAARCPDCGTLYRGPYALKRGTHVERPTLASPVPPG